MLLNPNRVPKSPGIGLTRADSHSRGQGGQHFSLTPSYTDTPGPWTKVWGTSGGRTSTHQAGERLWALPVLPLLAPQEVSADRRGQASQAGREGDDLPSWLHALLAMLPVTPHPLSLTGQERLPDGGCIHSELFQTEPTS